MTDHSTIEERLAAFKDRLIDEAQVLLPLWEPAVAVCGFGRCGSTMVMTMLDAGGLSPVEGTHPGSYEVSDPDELWRRDTEAFHGRAVKLLDSPAHHGSLPSAREWRVVWVDRDRHEQAKSMVKMVRAIGLPLEHDAVATLEASFGRDRAPLLRALSDWASTITLLRFEDVLTNPILAARKLTAVFPKLDVLKAAGAVRARGAACLPDLAVEDELTAVTTFRRVG